MKQTTVEWLEHMLLIILNEEEFKKITYTIEQAKEMEKKQLKEMYLKGIENYDPTFNKMQLG
jgi:hypothetical protein